MAIPNILVPDIPFGTLQESPIMDDNSSDISDISDNISDTSKDLPDPIPNFIPASVPESVSDTHSTGTYQTPHISLVSAEAFTRSMHAEGAQCCLASLYDPNRVTRCAATDSSNPDLEGVLEVYHEFTDVFFKKMLKTYL